MKRRKNGQASVEEHPKGSGVYRVRARVRDERTGKSRLATIASGVPRAEADELADAYIEVRNASVLREGLTLDQFGKGFLDRRERAGVRGIRTDRNRWKNHVAEDELGSQLVSSLTRRDILDWLDRRKGQHQTRKNVLNLLRVALQEKLSEFGLSSFVSAALDRELIGSNPARDVRLHAATRMMAEDDLDGILNPAEQQRLLAAVPEDSRPMVVFALLTGIRQAEQWWLKPEDISRTSVTIRRSSRGKPLKNGKNRTVFLRELAQRALELARGDSDWVGPTQYRAAVAQKAKHLAVGIAGSKRRSFDGAFGGTTCATRAPRITARVMEGPQVVARRSLSDARALERQSHRALRAQIGGDNATRRGRDIVPKKFPTAASSDR